MRSVWTVCQKLRFTKTNESSESEWPMYSQDDAVRILRAGHAQLTFVRVNGEKIVSAAQCHLAEDKHPLLWALASLSALQELELRGEIQDHEFGELLKRLTNLRALDINNTTLNGASLQHLKKLPKLEKLSLGSSIGLLGLSSLGGHLPIGQDGLLAIGELRCLKSLDFSRSNLKDDDMAPLAGLTELHTLSLRKTKINGSGLNALSSVKGLEKLDLAGTRLTDLELRNLAVFSALKYLDIGATAVRSLSGLEQLENLEDLRVGGNELDYNAFNVIGKLKNLRRLLISSPKPLEFTNFQRLAGLSRLEDVSLPSQAFSGDSLKGLCFLDGIKNLSLDNAGINDSALANLSNLRSLESLVISGTDLDLNQA